MTDSDPSDVSLTDIADDDAEHNSERERRMKKSLNERSVPIEALEEKIEEWREEPGLYNPNMMTDRMQHATQNDCANELQELIEDYE